MFVHGALCVSYSGQCFSSEAWGGRSANRGQCAQACRLPYELIVDGAASSPWATRATCSRPATSTRCARCRRSCSIGVSALKIEGRYKDADYVALTTAAYRQAVDEAWAGLPLSITPRRGTAAGAGLSRGLGPYFVTGTNHQAVVDGPRAAPPRRADGQGRARAGRSACIVAPDPARTPSPRSSRATAWSSTPPTGAARRSRKRAAASTRSRRCSGGQLELQLRQRRGQLQPHPRRRPALAHPRPGARQGCAPVHRGRPRRCTASRCACA